MIDHSSICYVNKTIIFIIYIFFFLLVLTMEKSNSEINIFQILIFLKSKISYIYIYRKVNHLAWNRILLYQILELYLFINFS